MRHFLARPSMAALALVSIVSCQAIPPGEPLGKTGSAPSVQVVAHRGCWDAAPENSQAAITACAALDVDVVEIDVRQTADGVLVLMHDDTIDRMTAGQGSLAAIEWTALSALRLRNGIGGPDAAFSSQTPARLEDALAAAPDGMLINLDVKDSDVFAATLDAVQDDPTQDAIIIKTAIAPDAPEFEKFRDIGGVRFMPVVRQCQDGQRSSPDQYCAYKPEQILADYAGLVLFGYELIFADEAFLAGFAHAIADRDVQVWVNTLAPEHAAGHVDALALADPHAHWGRLIDLGATMIQTDYPAGLRAYLHERDAQP